jgi:hypothetical protein
MGSWFVHPFAEQGQREGAVRGSKHKEKSTRGLMRICRCLLCFLFLSPGAGCFLPSSFVVDVRCAVKHWLRLDPSVLALEFD